jgi:branched-chain amino acid transport system substrate-binding protein
VNHGNIQGQKFALLIGVSEYGAGFSRLRCPPNSIEEVRKVLIDPNIGEFHPNNVVSLNNPNLSEMQSAIGDFFSKRNSRDLVLFYFTGHGVKDERGDFFFTTCETRQDISGYLNRGTAVPASFVRKEMTNCYSRRQVAILDCCFSGAFPDGTMAMDDQKIDLEKQLSGEGRAILTAATDTNYALEHEGEYLSAYTRYLVAGLRDAADIPENQELIQVGHLHKYIRDKLRTAAPSMSPQIYAAREGHEIVLAKTSIDNKERQFRKLLERYYQEYDGKITPIIRRVIEKKRKSLGIESRRAEEIESEVAQPYRERDENLKEYEEVYEEAIEFEFPISSRTEKQLKEYQNTLKLRDEDVQPIQERLNRQRRRKKYEKSWFSSVADRFTVWRREAVLRKSNLLFALFFCFAVLAAIFFNDVFEQKEPMETSSPRLLISGMSLDIPESIDGRASFGEEFLMKEDQLADCQSLDSFMQLREEGADFMREAISLSVDHRELFRNAMYKFQEAGKSCGNDPETLIYENNAELGNSNAYNVAVSVPISGKNPGNAAMMLRGFAQAQDAINGDDQNNVRIRLMVIDDADDPTIAANRVANALIDTDISAVIGHWSSDTSKPAAQIYSGEGLIFITPISIFDDLANLSNVFRVSATSQKGADLLGSYITQELSGRTARIYFDETNPYTDELRGKLAGFLNAKGIGVESEIDLSDLNDIQTAVENLNELVEETEMLLVFLPSADSAVKALNIIQGVRTRYSSLPIVGDMANLYIKETLSGDYNTRGMVLAPSWSIETNENTPLVSELRRDENNYWYGADVNYAAATSYSALVAIATALQRVQNAEEPTHADVAATLISEDFSIRGAFEEPIKFLPTGESTVNPQLVKVCEGPEGWSLTFKFEAVDLNNPDCPNR